MRYVVATKRIDGVSTNYTRRLLKMIFLFLIKNRVQWGSNFVAERLSGKSDFVVLLTECSGKNTFV